MALMSKKTLRVGISAAIIVGTLGVFMAQSMQDSLAYFKNVDEVMTEPAQWYDKDMNLHGWVVPNSIYGNPETLEWQFEVKSGTHVVLARYQGTVPDTFQDDAEVVLKGRLTAAGFHVQPDGVVAKCPSKYEAQVGPTSSR